LTASFDFYVYVYPYCLTASFRSKFKSKVVFIIFIKSYITVFNIQSWLCLEFGKFGLLQYFSCFRIYRFLTGGLN